MFTPGTKRSNLSSRKERSLGNSLNVLDSPITPVPENRQPANDNSIPNRPSTGTPAPWAPRLSVLARIPPVNKNEKGNEIDPVKPVFVAEFPQSVRDEQSSFLGKHLPGHTCISGGMDKKTCLSWIICGNRLFIWSYLSSAPSRKCIVLKLPSDVIEGVYTSATSYYGKNWLLSVVHWDTSSQGKSKVVQQCKSAGVIICNQKTGAVIYWPDIYREEGRTPMNSPASSYESDAVSSPVIRSSSPNRHQQYSSLKSNFNSLISCVVSDADHVCVALACSSNGELWQFRCSPTGIQRKNICLDMMDLSSQGNDNGQFVGSKGYRRLVWRFSGFPTEESKQQFFLLTDHEIQCFSIELHHDLCVSKLWSDEIVGTDGDLGIKKDLAGQKRIWPLDMQVDDHGKVITILVATFCKDRVSSSSYTQYSLLTMQYKSAVSFSSDAQKRILEKKAPIQVIIPKARVEDEDFLFSMKLRVGGKPSGSAIILSGDGTATVSHYYGNSTRLYQFDLPNDAGKVLDASVLPSADEGEDGAWVVLTEKAGIWAIPEKAIVLGGVEPPERSLSRRGSSNEGSVQAERRNLTVVGNIAPRSTNSDALDTGDRKRAIMTGIARRTVHDEESEALLGHLFRDFLLSGQVDGALEKLQNSGAFERDAETNVFARISKSIVDTLAKHWTTTRGAEIVAMSIISTQLVDKQQKHKKFLEFLALAKCHEELCSRQRHSLQIILEHGEKLAGMIQLRDLQNLISQNRSVEIGSPRNGLENQIAGGIWDLIQLVGEKARWNTVLLMDRDNAEVFYSKVSDIEEVFYCSHKQLEYLISTEHPLEVQMQRACELSNACVTVIRSAMQYRNEHQIWYPPPEGLTPWYSQPVVRNGLWSIASLFLQLLSETSGLDVSAKTYIYNHLEALAEVLLEAYTGAITAKVERGEEHKGLLEEYWSRRDTLLESLYQQVKGFVEAGCQEVHGELGAPNEEILRKHSSSLLAIAKRHEGYRTMWTICCDLNDSVLLRNLMHESVGPQGGFSYFVFKQLYKERQFSKLLRLGEEFPEELSIFLKHHNNLLWLHEVFLHQFSLASDTLHELSLSQEKTSMSTDEEGTEFDFGNSELTLAERKRLLNLSKIAAVAGKNTDWEVKVERIEADMKILKLQEIITKAACSNEAIEQRLLRPDELIELCLKSENSELALLVFDVFAWTSSSFRKSHRNLLEDCWRNAADQDDWGQLYETSVDEGWSEEDTLRQLRDTVLFQASSRYYGPQAQAIEGGFNEVLPLRKDIVLAPLLEDLNSSVEEMPLLDDLNSSVEGILMQHKNFADAGKLMLTAIMLGAPQDDMKVDEGPFPMG